MYIHTVGVGTPAGGRQTSSVVTPTSANCLTGSCTNTFLMSETGTGTSIISIITLSVCLSVYLSLSVCLSVSVCLSFVHPLSLAPSFYPSLLLPSFSPFVSLAGSVSLSLCLCLFVLLSPYLSQFVTGALFDKERIYSRTGHFLGHPK